MAKYQVECPACNATSTVRLYGPSRDRQYKLEKWDWTCDTCKERQRQDENTRAASANSEAGLPALTGTEKQIGWAETIRAERIGEIDQAVASYEGKLASLNDERRRRADEVAVEDGFASIEESLSCVREAAELLRSERSAHWWIDNRTTRIGHLILERAKIVAKERKDRIPAALDAQAEATVRPEVPLTETVAEIRPLENAVEVIFPEKRDDFWKIIKKQLGYEWAGSCWRRRISVTTGAAKDRAAEAGHRLLAAGFIVRLFDPAVRAAAVSGDYPPEVTRWVTKRTAGSYAGWFAIRWQEDNRRLYDAARKLPGSRWDKPSVVVPAEQFEEVLDFAERCEFGVSPGALEISEAARRIRDAALTASPPPVEDRTPPTPQEVKALQKGFSSYSLYTGGKENLCCWVFKFPAPVGCLDAPFHAGLYRDNRVQKFLTTQGNTLHFYALDGSAVRLIRISGLSPTAMAIFRDVVRKQVAGPLDLFIYNAAVNHLQRLSQEEIFHVGKQFNHKAEESPQ
ncbi:hypothetical protein [Geoalkalibacter sp.]|uniref:hypothetical protein n=1 Tax=Geoalkalibacter sp. TaxID=3041440 RepID=UPI00272EC725|nr:hypothetical protein [Geoalkalibacter sp.]